MEQPITALQTPDCDWLLHRFIEVNFSKLTDSNQIFRNDFVCLHYHHCDISSQIIEFVIFYPCELSITTIDSMAPPQESILNRSLLTSRDLKAKVVRLETDGKWMAFYGLLSIKMGRQYLCVPDRLTDQATSPPLRGGRDVLLLLLKEVDSARLRESDIHHISPKTPAPHYQPIDRNKRKGKIVEDYSRDKAA